MIDWANMTTTREEHDQIVLIAKRVIEQNPQARMMDLMMDLEAVHSVTPLRLADMVEASFGDVMHDVCGIVKHLDRETGKLTDCFLPRFAA